MNRSKTSSEQGFTLIEVLISIVLVGVVALFAFGSYLITQRSTKTLIGSSDVQNALCLSKQQIDQTVRMADEVIIGDRLHQPPNPQIYKAIYVENGTLIYVEDGEIRAFGGSLEGVDMGVVFQKGTQSGGTGPSRNLCIKLCGSTEGQSESQLEWEITILNVESNIGIVDLTDGQGTHLYFTLPQAP